MNVLFINMPIRVTAPPNVVPLGVGILSGLTKNLGHHCEVLDLNSIRPVVDSDYVAKRLGEYECGFDAVCLSGMITTLRWQQVVARLVRAQFPETCLISGGGLASDFDEILFAWIPELDVTVQGEGEPVMERIYDNVQNLRGSKKIFGPEVVQNLRDVPLIDWEQFDMETYVRNPIWGIGAGNASWTPFATKRSLNLISSRGCPYSCHFCDRKATGGRNYRTYETQQILAEVRMAIERYSVEFIGFVDDNFICNKNGLDELLAGLAETGISWGCHGRLNEVDRAVAQRLKQSGCVYIGFGAESADQYVLQQMNKKNSIPQMSAAVRACQEVGITPNCTWIMGYPGETRQSLRRTARFIIDHELSQKAMFVATAYPGTMFFEQVKEKILHLYGNLYDYVIDLDDASKVLQHDGQVLNYSAMSDEEFLECKALIEAGDMAAI